jgi:hypothetical protein
LQAKIAAKKAATEQQQQQQSSSTNNTVLRKKLPEKKAEAFDDLLNAGLAAGRKSSGEVNTVQSCNRMLWAGRIGFEAQRMLFGGDDRPNVKVLYENFLSEGMIAFVILLEEVDTERRREFYATKPCHRSLLFIAWDDLLPNPNLSERILIHFR